MRKKNYLPAKLYRIRKNKTRRQKLATNIQQLALRTLAALTGITPIIESINDKAFKRLKADYQKTAAFLRALRKKIFHISLARTGPFLRIKKQLCALQAHPFVTPQEGASVFIPAASNAAKASRGLSVPRISTPILTISP